MGDPWEVWEDVALEPHTEQLSNQIGIRIYEAPIADSCSRLAMMCMASQHPIVLNRSPARDLARENSGWMNEPPSLVLKLCAPCTDTFFSLHPNLSITSRLPSSFALARLSCFLGASLSRIAACFAFGTSANEPTHRLLRTPSTTHHSELYRSRSAFSRQSESSSSKLRRFEAARVWRGLRREASAKFSVDCASRRGVLLVAVTGAERLRKPCCGGSHSSAPRVVAAVTWQ